MSKQKKSYSVIEKAEYFNNLAFKQKDVKKFRFFLKYAEQLEDFASASCFDFENSFDFYDYPSSINTVEDAEKYVKKRWIIRQADRNGDLSLKKGKVVINNYKKHEENWNIFKRMSKYFGGK